MEFVVEFFKCQTCGKDHAPEEMLDVLILPPPEEPQNGVPFAICGCCGETLIGTDVEHRVIVMDLH